MRCIEKLPWCAWSVQMQFDLVTEEIALRYSTENKALILVDALWFPLAPLGSNEFCCRTTLLLLQKNGRDFFGKADHLAAFKKETPHTWSVYKARFSVGLFRL
ncbi:MAG: hypothetical protein GY822_26975 [Deltaproteobacteria bacterium]|nr:hypothetical protein [Deltaproteobacteria bacterium]